MGDGKKRSGFRTSGAARRRCWKHPLRRWQAENMRSGRAPSYAATPVCSSAGLAAMFCLTPGGTATLRDCIPICLRIGCPLRRPGLVLLLITSLDMRKRHDMRKPQFAVGALLLFSIFFLPSLLPLPSVGLRQLLSDLAAAACVVFLDLQYWRHIWKVK